MSSIYTSIILWSDTKVVVVVHTVDEYGVLDLV